MILSSPINFKYPFELIIVQLKNFYYYATILVFLNHTRTMPTDNEKNYTSLRLYSFPFILQFRINWWERRFVWVWPYTSKRASFLACRSRTTRACPPLKARVRRVIRTRATGAKISRVGTNRIGLSSALINQRGYRCARSRKIDCESIQTTCVCVGGDVTWIEFLAFYDRVSFLIRGERWCFIQRWGNGDGLDHRVDRISYFKNSWWRIV